MGLTDRLPQPGPTRRRAAGIGLALLVVLVAASATLAAAYKPKAWFDAPLPGAILPLAPYLVVVHAADDSGITRVHVVVDGEIAAPQTPSGTGDLVSVSWTWMPNGVGQHLITVVAEGKDGSFSDPVGVGVTVDATAGPLPTPDLSPEASPSGGPTATPLASGATPGPSPTPRVTATPGPTSVPTATPGPTSVPTPTPVPTPCAPAGPTLTSPGLYEEITANPPTLFWNPAEQPCAVDQFHIVVDTDSGLAQPWYFDTVVANDTTFYTLPDLLPGSPVCIYYYWTVYAVDADGNEFLTETSAFLVCTRA